VSHEQDSRLNIQAHIHVLSKIEQWLFQKRTNLSCAEHSFPRLTLEPLFGIKYAYIDCEYIFEYEAQNDIKNFDGRINPAHHPGDSLQRRGLRLQHYPESQRHFRRAS
jgi:hypothetical protein